MVEPGSPCRSRSGTVAGAHHAGRFTKVPRPAKLLRVPTPTDPDRPRAGAAVAARHPAADADPR
ncbi:hypothetical protein [Nonomuraea angiospora]|uniref:hypothetical protein n=1 Tax=Nonomuraea angiospora TaxID=46172 RepID=UPI003EC0069E